jgi:branched-chain amino acid transport system permease protein
MRPGAARAVGWVLAIAAAAAVPYLGASRFVLHLGTLTFIWAVTASYWNLLNAYAGILSLGNLGFFAMGAYISSVLAIETGLSPFVTMVIAAVVTMAIVTVFLGLPVLRLRGIFIALLTLVFADALPSVVSLTGRWTGGGIGLLGIPTFLPRLERWQAYYFALAFAIVAHVALAAILRSRTGLAFVALRDSEEFATAIGVDRFREGLKVFAISSFFTAMAGAVFAHTLGQISPGMLDIDQFVLVLAMWLLGGAGTFAGPLIGALLVTVGNEYLRVYGSLRLGVLGASIVLVVLYFPGGIMQIVRAVGARITWREALTPDPAARPVKVGDDARGAR